MKALLSPEGASQCQKRNTQRMQNTEWVARRLCLPAARAALTVDQWVAVRGALHVQRSIISDRSASGQPHRSRASVPQSDATKPRDSGAAH